MRFRSEEEILVERGDKLARACAKAGVRENDLAMLLAHLRRHRNPKGSLKLLASLERSTFAGRNKGTRKQMEALHQHGRPVLNRARNWQEAATVVGWAKRLMVVHGGKK